jgi:WD40 repeat protein
MKVTTLYEGHFDEITKLAVIGTNIISASLDGTIRTWDTREPPKKLELQMEQEPKKDSSALTEEEERELAELMSEDED